MNASPLDVIAAIVTSASQEGTALEEHVHLALPGLIKQVLLIWRMLHQNVLHGDFAIDQLVKSYCLSWDAYIGP